MTVHLAEFLAVAVVVIVTPGPDTALTIRNSLLGGRRGGALTALGVSTGQATWAVATSVGIAALLAASKPAFVAVKVIGAAYLLFLGAQSLLAAYRGSRAGAPTRARAATVRLPARTAYRQGLVSNLSNPKMAAFFPSLLPQFAGDGEPGFWPLFVLGVVFSALTLVWLSAYAVAVAKAGDVLRRGPIRRIIDAAMGAVMIALGVRVAVERR